MLTSTLCTQAAIDTLHVQCIPLVCNVSIVFKCCIHVHACVFKQWNPVCMYMYWMYNTCTCICIMYGCHLVWIETARIRLSIDNHSHCRKHSNNVEYMCILLIWVYVDGCHFALLSYTGNCIAFETQSIQVK